MPDFTPLTSRSTTLLPKITYAWFAVAFCGQLIFAIYIFLQYILSGLMGNLDRWSEMSTGGHIPGDTMSNIAFGIHVILAGIITLGGPLQLWPLIRSNYPRFHRINGRIYIGAAYIISIVGIFLIWGRGTVGDLLAHTMTTINGLIIIVAATFTIRYAIAGKIIQHQQWAIRLFLAMSGVYFFRVLLNAWMVVIGTGIDFDSFTGYGLDIVGFCSYIAPVLIAEAYFRIDQGASIITKNTMIGFLGLLILLFLIGTVVATMFMWGPEMVKRMGFYLSSVILFSH